MITAERAKKLIAVQFVCGLALVATVQVLEVVIHVYYGHHTHLNDLVARVMTAAAAIAWLLMPFTVGLAWTQPVIRKSSLLAGALILCIALSSFLVNRIEISSIAILVVSMVVPAVIGRTISWISEKCGSPVQGDN